MSRLSLSTEPGTVVQGIELETYQKMRIVNMHKDELNKLFMKFLFVGTNLFSTTLITGDDDDGMIRFDTVKPYMGRLFTIVIKYASGF